MKKCLMCNNKIERGAYCPSCYAYLRKHPEGIYPIPEKGVALATNGDPICNECGKAFTKLGNHIHAVHHMTMVEYRDKWGIPHNVRLTNAQTYQPKMRAYVKKHYRKVVKKNLWLLGKLTRYTKGNGGRHAKHK